MEVKNSQHGWLAGAFCLSPSPWRLSPGGGKSWFPAGFRCVTKKAQGFCWLGRLSSTRSRQGGQNPGRMLVLRASYQVSVFVVALSARGEGAPVP